MYQRYQKVLPESKNVGKSESNVAIEGHWRQLRVILDLPKAECHQNSKCRHDDIHGGGGCCYYQTTIGHSKLFFPIVVI